MLRYYISENMKIKNTLVQKLTFIAPVSVILISVLLTGNYFQIDIYNWWYTLIIPAGLPLICSLLFKIDGGKKKNRGVLGLYVDLKKVWMAKVFTGVSIIAVSTLLIFIAAQLVVYIIPFKSAYPIPLKDGAIATVLIIITTAWQVPLYIFISRKIGMVISVILGMSISIGSIPISTENMWWLCPFSYTSRIMCPILKILPNGLMAVPESVTFKPELLNVSSVGFAVIVTIILFLVITILTGRLYENVEAR